MAVAEVLESRRLLAATLVAAYALDEGTGTTVSDLSGAGNNGTLANATWATGKFGNALKFTGAANSMVTIPDSASLHLGSGMTLEAWVYPTSLTSPGGNWDAVVAKDHTGSSDDVSYALYGAQGTGTGPATHVLIGTDRGTANVTALPLNQWTFIAGTYDGATLRTYVNGSQVASKSQTGTIQATTNPLHLGGDWSGEMFTGLIDNVRIYNGALTAAQVQTDMNAPIATVPDTTPPTVAMTAPAGGSTVSGTIAVSANATDNVAVASVQFQLDGANLGAPVTASPYTFQWNTTAAAAGSHTLTAIATDTSGNKATSSPDVVTVSNVPVPPAVIAQTPAANAGNVPLNSTVTATFNESIQPATLSFTVVDSANNPASGNTSYNDASHTATFTPASPWKPLSNYTVTVAGAKDLSGNVMTAADVWSFSTADATPSPLQVIAKSPASNATGVLLGSVVTATFNEAIQPSTLSFVLRDDKTNPVPATVTYNASNLTATLTPTVTLLKGMTYNAIVSGATDLAGNVMDHVSWLFTAQSPGTGPYSIWSPSSYPGIATDNDPSPTEVGVKFRTDVAGVIAGLRFYKGSTNTGTHVGDLWTSSGQLLATATFTGESATGWQQVNFASPVAIQSNTTYVASYHTSAGHYAEDDNYFAGQGVDSVPLHALKAGIDGVNGVYINSASPAFPTQNWLSANYWVDVVFDSSTPTGPLVASEAPAQGATNASIGTAISATLTESVQPTTISFAVKDSANNPVPGTVSYSDATHTVTFTPTAALSSATTYTATLSGATDLAGVSMASPFNWSFTTAVPAQDPTVVGQWSGVMNWPLVALNQVLLSNGNVLMWDGGPACIGSSSAAVYNPTTGVFTAVPVDNSADNNDIFCAGNTLLSDGTVIVVGGHDCTAKLTGITSTNFFNPVTQQWTRGPNMGYARWYPTSTTLPDGRVLVTAGSDLTDTSLVTTPEVYDPVAKTWTKLTNANQSINNYPFMFVLPDGRILEAGSDEAPLVTKVLNVATQQWTVVDPTAVDGSSGVMYRPGMILKAGTSCPEEGEVLSAPAAATAYVLDMTQPTPRWKQVQSMANARSWLDLTMLPDGNVLATGGSRTIGGVDPTSAVLPAEEWNPLTQTWTTMASMATPRMYHSSALLLPDGRVLVAGGGHNYVNNSDYYNSEIYSPPYLFKGARPTITSAPSELQYNAGFSVQTPDASDISSVVLVAPGTVTHAFDENQRYVPLSFTTSAGSLNVQAPLNSNLAPPGNYMLFIVNSKGVPSVAGWVHFSVPGADTQPPTAPPTLSATGGIGVASLSWGASTDNVGVTGYTVYRSTVSGFVPSSSNLIGSTGAGTTTYTDNLPAGSYYYLVIAKDAAGNLSGPSPQASAVVMADSIAPTVSLTAPVGGATISGSVTISANAADNVAVGSVQFQLDGSNLGSPVKSSPYSYQWNTAAASNGTHTLTAIATDTSGNSTTSAPVSVTVSNTAGLVASYSFDGGSGTTLNDDSGNGHNGTISNATWVAGKWGSALSFSGNVNSFVNIPDAAALELSSGMTLEAWINPTSLASPNFGWDAVIAKEHLNSGNDISYALYAAQGTGTGPGGHILVGSTDFGTSGGSPPPLNGWTFVCATFDGTTLKTYVNGTLIGQQNTSGKILATTDPLKIGGDWSGEMFTGLIDNVRIYNIALSASQIQSDMGAAVAAPSAPAMAMASLAQTVSSSPASTTIASTVITGSSSADRSTEDEPMALTEHKNRKNRGRLRPYRLP